MSRGRIQVATLELDFSAHNVGPTTPYEVSASLAYDVNKIRVFDTSGKAMKLMIGAATTEVQACKIPPGDGADIQVLLSKGQRISLLAESGITISAGRVILSLYQ